MKEIRFEEAIKRFEEIVNRLEAGDIPLDDSIKLFEEGEKLYQICLKRLDEAEKKVEILLKDKNGIRLLKPFELKKSQSENEDRGCFKRIFKGEAGQADKGLMIICQRLTCHSRRCIRPYDTAFLQAERG